MIKMYLEKEIEEKTNFFNNQDNDLGITQEDKRKHEESTLALPKG